MIKPKSKKSIQLAAILAVIAYAFTVFDTVSAEVVRKDNSEDLVKSGVSLYEWQDTAVKDPKFIVIAVHGAAQQGGVLDTLGRSLASLGYLVLAPDLRGAGRWSSMSPQHSTGSFGDFVQSCEDLSKLLRMLRKEHPKSQFFCIGESAGSTVVLSAMVKDSSKVKGIILCSAGSEPKVHSPGTMGPEFYKKLMHVTTPVDMSEFMGHYSSDDKRVSDEMIHDPLGRSKLSALDLLGTFNFIQQGSVLATEIPKTLPTLLIQGKEDQIINANSAVKLLAKINSTDKNLLMLPDVGHILIGTTYVKPVVEDSIINWLAAHGGMKAAAVSHSMPPNAPQIQSFSRLPPDTGGAGFEQRRPSLINPEEWKAEQAAEQAAENLSQKSNQNSTQNSLRSSSKSLPQNTASDNMSRATQTAAQNTASTNSVAPALTESPSGDGRIDANQIGKNEAEASSTAKAGGLNMKDSDPVPSLRELLNP